MSSVFFIGLVLSAIAFVMLGSSPSARKRPSPSRVAEVRKLGETLTSLNKSEYDQ